jgi:hypothetical protein
MKKKVKIYKATDGKGKYINKTKKFLMGGMTQKKSILDSYAENVYNQLKSNIDPESVYYGLITAGIDKKTAGSLISSVIAKMIKAGLYDPDFFKEMTRYMPEEVMSNQPEPEVTPDDITTPDANAEEEMAEESYDYLFGDSMKGGFGFSEDEETSEQQTGELAQAAKGGDMEKCPKGKYWNGRYCAPIKVVTEDGKKIKVVPTALEMEHPHDNPYNIELQRVSAIDEILKRQKEKGWDDDTTNKMICQDGSCHAVSIDDDTPIEEYVPPVNRTYDEIYPEVDHDKYPTIDDFIFAAEYYNDEGENPPDDLLPSNRKKVVDIEPEESVPEEVVPMDDITPDVVEEEELIRPDFRLPEVEPMDLITPDPLDLPDIWEDIPEEDVPEEGGSFVEPVEPGSLPARNGRQWGGLKGFLQKVFTDKKYSGPIFQKRIKEEGGAMDQQDSMLEQQDNIIPFDFYMDNSFGETQLIKFPNVSEYLKDYSPQTWNSVSKMGNGGMTKNKFVKSLLKEGGAGQGDRMDTLTSEVAKKSNSFKSKLKELSTTALGKDIYDKSMELGDPKLMEMAQNLGQQKSEDQVTMAAGGELPKAFDGKTIKRLVGNVIEDGDDYVIINGRRLRRTGANKGPTAFQQATKWIDTKLPGLRDVNVDDYTTFSADEMKKFGQIKNVASEAAYRTDLTDQSGILRALADESRTGAITDADMGLIFNDLAIRDRQDITQMLESGYNPFPNLLADSKQSLADIMKTDSDIAQQIEAFKAIRKDKIKPLSSEEATELMLDLEKTPFPGYQMGHMTDMGGLGRPSIFMYGDRPIIMGNPVAFADQLDSKEALLAMFRKNMRDTSKVPVGSMLTHADSLTLDSLPLATKNLEMLKRNPLYGDKEFLWQYGKMGDSDFITQHYFKPKAIRDFAGGNAAARTKEVQDAIAQSRLNYLMTMMESGAMPKSKYPIKMFDLEKSKDLLAPAAIKFGVGSPAYNRFKRQLNLGLGPGRIGDDAIKRGLDDFVIPYSAVMKIKEQGGFVDPEGDLTKFTEGAEMFRNGGAAYRVAKAFGKAGKDQQDYLMSIPDDQVMKAVKNYNRVRVPYNYYRGKRPLLNFLFDTLVPINRYRQNTPGKVRSSNPRYMSGKRYRGPYDNLTPVRTEVTKTNWRGMPKKWVDYYSVNNSGSDNELTAATDPRFMVKDPIAQEEINRYTKTRDKRKAYRAEKKIEKDEALDNVFKPGGFFENRSANAAQAFTNNVGVNAPMPNVSMPSEGIVPPIAGEYPMTQEQAEGPFYPTPTGAAPTDPNKEEKEKKQPVVNQDEFVRIMNTQKGSNTSTKLGSGNVDFGIAGIKALAGKKRLMNTADNYLESQDGTVRPENFMAMTPSTYEGTHVDLGSRTGDFNKDLGQMDYTGLATAMVGGTPMADNGITVTGDMGPYESPFMSSRSLIAPTMTPELATKRILQTAGSQPIYGDSGVTGQLVKDTNLETYANLFPNAQFGGYLDDLEEGGMYDLTEEYIEYLFANGVQLDYM